ncbi:hypothetical protein [Vibrio harveyi]|uniref:hypothetical protein n=1 Tax=Vibrio harveyi TaxID=669 RepID=UPI003CF99960
MIITVISECEKASWKRTRRILSGYLFQIGRRTWQGHISEEGLKDLGEALKSSASKNTSVICHRHRGGRPATIEWIIGSKKRFNRDGLYSYSQSKKSYDYIRYEHKLLLIAEQLVGLAGLFHDVGKTTVGFQFKLALSIGCKETAKVGDPIRHEVLSAVFLLPLIDNPQLIHNLSTIDGVRQYFQNHGLEAINTFKDEILKLQEKLNNPENSVEANKELEDILLSMQKMSSSDIWAKNSLIASLKWLILTHHKLPNGKVHETKIKIGNKRRAKTIVKHFIEDSFNYEFIRTSDFSSVERFFEFQNTVPWNSDKWCLAVSEKINCIKKLGALEDAVKIDEEGAFGTILAFKARPSLVYADRIESANKDICEHQDPSIHAYANTIFDEDKGVYVWADTVIEHLSKVSSSAERYFETLFIRDKDYNKALPSIPLANRPPSLENVAKPDNDSPFYWQYHIAKELKAHRGTIGGSFNIVLSKTGSGKTAACPIIMNALSDTDLRFTLALGMRTLTTQSYSAYTDSLIGFNKDQVALLVGSSTLIEPDDDSLDATGSASLTSDLQEHFVLAEESNYESELLDLFPNDKMKGLITSPISVMTVDHIVSAVNQKRSSHSSILLHAMSTDLILDEIDDYDASDLVALGKLIYLFASYGRKVLISSATTPPSVIQALAKAYQRGYSEYAELTNSSNTVSYAFMSHAEPYLELIRTNDTEQFNRSYDSFANNLVDKISQEKVRHKAVIVDIGNNGTYDFNLLDQQCVRFHKEHHVTMDDGFNLSVGFVRFNNVSSAQNYALHLNKAELEIEHRVICYHSRMLNLDRYIIEQFLNSALNRNNNNQPYNNPTIAKAIKEARSRGCSNLSVIVSTTNIQETGRDHDYDWIICEPKSDKSVAQSAGRLWRHRRDKIAYTPNVGILSKTLRGYSSLDDPWGFPGIESDRDGSSASYPLTPKISHEMSEKMALADIDCDELSNLSEIDTTSAISTSMIDEAITAKSTILKPVDCHKGYISALEHIRNCDYLNPLVKSEGDFSDLMSYIERTDTKLNAYHWNQNGFRKKTKNKIRVKVRQRNPKQNGFRNDWIMINELEKDPAKREMVCDIDNIEIRDSKFLFTYDADTEMENIAQKFKQSSRFFYEDQLSCTMEISKSQTSIRYCQELGFLK